MSSIWGERYKVSLFGESHGSAIGVVIDGCIPGVKVDENFVKSEMQRRSPRGFKDVAEANLVTPRAEADEYEILSGVVNSYTTGTPICVMIRNTDKRSGDYTEFKNMPRPGHADYTGQIRYKGMNDIRGGGHFSGRITAGLVFAGALAKQILSERGIYIGAHLKKICTCEDESFQEENMNQENFSKLRDMRIPVVDENMGDKFRETIKNARENADSVGGVVEVGIIGLEPGFGNPFFDSVESRLAHILFSIPGVKGVEFGMGFGIAEMTGSEANDEFYFDESDGRRVKTRSNNNGGINGGITNGMPLVFRVAFKPTPSIEKTQRTVDLSQGRDVEFNIKGRHDPCIAIRGVSVTESAAAICILDILLNGGFFNG